MSEELYGLDEEQVQRLARMLADYESGRLFTPPFPRPEVLPPLQWTQLGKASSAITAAAGSSVGTGTVKLWRLETDNVHYTEQDLGATDDVNVFNPTTTAISSGDYVELFRDPYSGQWWCQPYPTAAAAPAFSGARVHPSAAQTIADFTFTYVAFNTEDFDVSGYHDNATNNSRLTPPAAGYYLVGGTVGFVANTTGQRQLHLALNRTDLFASTTQHAQAAGESNVLACSGIANFGAGDYAEMEIFQNSGGNLDTVATSTRFWMARLGT